jgi:hypothetical protein
MLSDLVGSATIVWRQRPPPPGAQRSRCGWLSKPVTGAQVAPASVDSKSAAGSTPANSRSGSSARPSVICQTCFSASPESAGKRTFASAGSCHVRPQLLLRAMRAPQCMLATPAQSRWRPARVSRAVAYTALPA